MHKSTSTDPSVMRSIMTILPTLMLCIGFVLMCGYSSMAVATDQTVAVKAANIIAAPMESVVSTAPATTATDATIIPAEGVVGAPIGAIGRENCDRNSNDWYTPQVIDLDEAMLRLEANPWDQEGLITLSQLADEELIAATDWLSRTDAIHATGGIPTHGHWLATGLLIVGSGESARLTWGVTKSRFEVIPVDVRTGEILEEINFLDTNPDLRVDLERLLSTQEGVNAVLAGYRPLPKQNEVGLYSTNPYNNSWTGILRECEYALSSRHRNGGSNVSYNGYTMGDWQYHQSDMYATNQALGKGNPCGRSYVPGTWGSVTSRGYQGGYCKFAAGCIIRRGSGFGWLPAGYSYGYINGSAAFPGDALQSPEGINHTAVVYKILLRNSDLSRVELDVVDSNYISTWALGRHPLVTHDKNGRLTSNQANPRSYGAWWPTSGCR